MKRNHGSIGILGALLSFPLLAGVAMGETYLDILLESSAYEVTEDAIVMDGFGWLAVPGKPQLPAKTQLFLLPPGARVLRLELLGSEKSELPGSFHIAASPPVLSLDHYPDFSRERKTREAWENERLVSYNSDEAYPAMPVQIVGSGSLRKYYYVALRFAPFAYFPSSGRLTHHQSVRARVYYRLPTEGSEAEMHVSRLLGERHVDGEAARLFENFASLAPLYEPPANSPGERDEIYDYVIITSDSFESAILASDFVDWKLSLGYSVRIMSLTDPEIAAQPGSDLPARIRNFLREYYGVWGIKYALLVGSHETLPMRYCFADPTNHQHTPGTPGDYGGSVPTDSYYADLSLSDEESWDLDGDGYPGEFGEDAPDFLTEISVGRIPSHSPLEITYTLDKIVRYEQDTGAWKDRALHAGAILFHEGQNGMDIPFRDGAVCMDLIETTSMDGWLVNHYCEHEGLVPSGYDWPALTESVFTFAWRSGFWGMVSWAGHGSTDGAWRHIWTWDDGDGIFETDGSDGYDWEAFLTDSSDLEDDYPSIVWSVSCSVGYPEAAPSGNLGVDLLTRPGFGAAAAVISASRTAYVTAYWPDDPGGTESMCCEFNRFLIDGPEGPELVGDAHFDSKFYCLVNFSLETYKEYKDQYGLNLYGDPAMARKGQILTSVEEEVPHASSSGSTLLQNHPNPFNPNTEISFELSRAEKVEIAIYSTSGRRLAVLFEGNLEAGMHSFNWGGRDDSGEPLPSGIYVCRAWSASGGTSRKLTLLK